MISNESNNRPIQSDGKTSSEIAHSRLRAMKDISIHTIEDNSNKRILNPYPVDNNKMWNQDHNKLSSKGD